MIAVGWDKKCAGETLCVCAGLDHTQERKVREKNKRVPKTKTDLK